MAGEVAVRLSVAGIAPVEAMAVLVAEPAIFRAVADAACMSVAVSEVQAVPVPVPVAVAPCCMPAAVQSAADVAPAAFAVPVVVPVPAALPAPSV